MIRSLAAAIFLSAFFIAGPAAGQGFQIPSGSPPQQEQEAAPSPQDESVLELALQYYERCYDALYPGHNDEARHDFCACSADLARRELSLRDLRLLATGEAAVDPNEDTGAIYKKIDFSIQGPCLHFFVRADEYEECIAEPKFRPLFRTQSAYESACLCISDGIGGFIEEFGRDMLAAAIERRAADTDPLQAIKQWPDYRRDMGRLRDECLAKYYHQ